MRREFRFVRAWHRVVEMESTDTADAKERSSVTPAWVRIQEETFTSWFNDRLGAYRKGYSGRRVTDLCSDLDDGTLLIKLLQQLTGKEVAKYSANPRNKWQKKENLTKAFKFMEEEGLNLVSIDPEHIHRGERKLILGLIWHLILHYQLKEWGTSGILHLTQALLFNWKFGNLSNDWRDGRLLMALINELVPDSKPNAMSLSPANAAHNCQSALLAAKVHLKIPQIITQDVMIALGNSDEMSMCFLTYLSYFIEPIRTAILAWVRKMIPGMQIQNFSTDWANGRAFLALMEACQPGLCPRWETLDSEDGKGCIEKALEVAKSQLGLTPGFKAGRLARGGALESKVLVFVAEIRASTTHSFKSPSAPVEEEIYSKMGESLKIILPAEIKEGMVDNLGAKITKNEVQPQSKPRYVDGKYDPESKQAYVEVAFEDVGCYSISTQPAQHSFTLIRIPLLQYAVKVLDPEKCVISKALSTLCLGQECSLKVRTKRAGPGKLTCTIKPLESLSVSMTDEKDESGEHNLLLKGHRVGEASVHLQWGPYDVPQGPIQLSVVDLHKCTFTCTQLQKNEKIYQSGEQIDFQITTREGGGCKPMMKVTYTQNSSRCVTYLKQDDYGLYTANFTPQEEGDYEVSIQIDGVHIHDSPKQLQVKNLPQVSSEHDQICQSPEQSIGTEQSTNESNSKEERLKTTHEPGPKSTADADQDSELKQVPDSLRDQEKERGDMIASEEAGDEKEHSKQVFDETSCPVSQLECITVSGMGLKKAFLNRPATFQIHAHQSGLIDDQTLVLEIRPTEQALSDPKADVVLDHADHKDGTYTATYKIASEGEYDITIYYKGQHVSESPYTIQVSTAASQCIAYGEVIKQSKPLMIGRRVRFYVNSTEAGEGDIKVTVTDHSTSEIEASVSIQKQNEDQIHCIQFTPTSVGTYEVHAEWNGTPIPGSPFKFQIVNPSKVQVYDLPASGDHVLVVPKPLTFTVDTSMAGDGEIKAVSQMKGGGEEEFKLKSLDDGKIIATYVPSRKGQMDLILTFMKIRVLQHPCDIVDPSSITVNGTGLYCKTSNAFKVTVDGLSENDLKYFTMAVKPPQGNSPLNHFNPGRDGTATVFFTPTMTGEYLVNAYLAGEPVRNSPLKVLAVTPSACRLEKSIPHYLALRGEVETEIDTSDAGPGQLTCTCHTLGDESTTVDCIAMSANDKHVKMKGIATGKSSISLKWAGYDILSIPYEVTVVDPQQCTFKISPTRGNAVKENTEVVVQIDATAACGCTPEVRLEDPQKKQVTVSIHQNEQGHFSASFLASTSGPHTLHVLVADIDVKGSPLSFTVQPQGAEILGTLPTTMLLGKSTTVQIATPKSELQPKVLCSATGALDASVKQVKSQHTEFQSMQCVYDVTITPMKVGEYEVNIEVGGSQLNEQPYTISVLDPTKCTLEMNIPHKMQKQQSKQITVKTTGAGKAELKVVSSNPSALRTELEQIHTDVYQVTLIPIEVTTAAVRVDLQYGGVSLPESPFTVDIFDVNQVVIEPPDLPVAYTNEPFPITVYTEGAGEGVPKIRYPGTQTLKAEVTKSKNGVYTISCTPLQVGPHSLSIYWNGLESPNSPITFQSCDPSRCAVHGLPSDNSMVTQRMIEVTVDYKKAGNGVITAEAEYSDKSTEDLPVRLGRNTAFFTVSPVTMGETKLRVLFNGKELLVRKWTFQKAKNIPCSKCIYFILLALLVAIASLSYYYLVLCNDCTLLAIEKPL